MEWLIKLFGGLFCLTIFSACLYKDPPPGPIPPGLIPPASKECDSLKNMEFIIRDLDWAEYGDIFGNDDYIFVATPFAAGSFYYCNNMLITIQPNGSSIEYEVAASYQVGLFFYSIQWPEGQFRVYTNKINSDLAGGRATLRIKYF